MAYDKTTNMQTLTVSAAILQCQNNFVALQDEALTIAGVKTFSASPIVPTPTTDMQASTKKYVDDLIQTLYPVGSIYCNKAVSTNPATLFGFGTWVALQGKVIVGLDPTQTEFDVLGETGGEKTHTLVTAEMPVHTHDMKASSGSGGGPPWISTQGTGSANDVTVVSASTGGDGAHNNLQPYLVAYMWERTA